VRLRVPERFAPLERRVDFLIAWFRDERPDDPFLMRLLRELLSVDFRDRVLIIAGQAFIAVLPLLILLASTLSSDGAAEVAEQMTERLGLDAATADQLELLFTIPPGATSGVSIVGYGLVLWSVTSLGRSIRRSFERRWQLPGATGFAASRDSLLGVLVLLLMGVSIALIGSVVREVLAFLPIVLFSQLAVAVASWALCIHLFLVRRVSLRRVLPGAVVGAVGQIVAGWVVSIYLPRLIAHDVARYGLIGFTFAIVSWLIVLAVVIVGVAALSGEIDREATRRAERKAARAGRGDSGESGEVEPDQR
jgi:uncharacterized BrkB/YihY/UPF0761 family membrane protein